MAEEEKKGLIIVHTGAGKGKTTAALGLALRAVGNGLRVLMVQFIKGSRRYGEQEAAKLLGEEKFAIRVMGRGYVKSTGPPAPADKAAAEEAWAYAISYGLVGLEPVLEALRQKPAEVHVILTGRNALAELLELADLVTEMREVKHPYQKGVKAQPGIEY